ncbi:hypothetical protein Bbelb_351180 [Branchiostoma belcheri]|nr:hypothetical protein Bbelb_351180 [Branchiostoma belcheri]
MWTRGKKALEVIMNRALKPKTSSSIIIMAGYLQQIEEQIFSLNEGFRGRFPGTVHFLPLTVQQLTDILEQKIKLSGYTISDYSREEMETAIGNIPMEVRSRHNARLVNQLIVKVNTGQDETTLTRPSTLLIHADNVLLKRGAEGHLAVKLIDFGSACWEYYPCSFDVREEMSSHIAPEVMKGGAVSTRHLPRHKMRHDTLLNQITKYIQHTSKEDEMEDITTMEKTEDGWEAFQRDMAILAFFERPISMCVSGWMGGLPERHGRPGLLRATHQYVCLVRMDGRPSRETWPSWPSSSDPSVCVCQDGWEAFQRDMAVLAFFGRPISMCVLSGWIGDLPERHGHPGLLRATHQYVCLVRMDGRPSRETWPSWPSSGDPSVCVSCQDGLETFQRDMAILAFFGRPISMCVLSGWMGDLPERHGHPGLHRATHQYVCVRMDGRPSRETWPSWPSSGDPSVCVSCQDGWETFQRDMAILAFFERPISMCVLSGWIGDLPERHGHPGLHRATHQYVCLVRMDGRPSRETWPSWPSSSDPSVCVSCQDGWETFQRDMAILAFFGRPISMCVLSGWIGDLPERHGHPGLHRATHQYVCLVRMDGRPSRETWPSWPSSGDPSVCVSCQDGLETFQRDMAILAFFERPINMCVLSGWMRGVPERHGHPGLLRATHQMDERRSGETWPSWPSSSDPSVCVSCQDGLETFQRDMAILAFFERPINMCVLSGWMRGVPERHGHPGLLRATHQYVCLKFFDDPLRGVVARMMYDAYVRLMNQTSTQRIATTDKKIVSECKDGLVLMENTDESTQEKTNESTQENTDESTQENTDESIRQNTDEPTRKNTDEPTQENTDEPTQENTDEPTQEITDEPTRQNTDEPTQENTDEPTQENTDESTQENTNESIRQNTDESTQENTDESTQENTNESIRQNTDKSTRQNTDEPTQENTNESIRQNTDEPTRQNTDESTQENTNESIRQNTDESTQENTNESIRQNTDESTQENTDKSTRQNTEEPTRQNTDEPTRQNTDEPTQQNTDEPTQQNTDEPTQQNTDKPTRQNTDESK